jgi:hypothetical protein
MKAPTHAIVIVSAAIIAGMASFPSAALAAELLVVSQRNCPNCKAWDIEVGSLYTKTEEGKSAPLRRIWIDERAGAAYIFKEPVAYAPTFVLLDGKAEIGRIVGYSDASMFWGLLSELLRKIGPDAPATMKNVENRSKNSDG